MKKIGWLLLLFCILTGSHFRSEYIHAQNSTITFAPGERLTYRLHYGFITAGEAVMDVEPQISFYNNTPVYKINVEGKSTGAFDVFMRIRNTYRSYIDTAQRIPLLFYRNVEEGNYKRQETTRFFHQTGTATVEIKDPGKEIQKKEYSINAQVQDMISGYYFIRNVDFNAISPGTVIGIDAFFEDKQYDFKVKYLGKEKIKTSIGRVNAIKMIPVMPDNQLFKGGESIKIWISDDANRIPLKVKAEMFVGAVEVDITSYGGLKYPFTARLSK